MTAGPRPRTVHLAATPGGHLDLLLALRPALEGFRRVWVVSPGATADSLRRDGEEVHTVPRFHGFSVHGVARSAPSLRLAARLRPSLVVSAGSGNMVPFCLASRALGARLIFVETMARITDASHAGRMLARLTDRVVVQWPEMRRHYPNAIVCRPTLLDGAVDTSGSPRSTGTGTFAAVGTHVDPFDRLLEIVAQGVDEGVLPPPAAAQTGAARREPDTVSCERWLNPSDLDARIRQARYFICHAGSGLIARSLRSNLRPLVVARRAGLGEHVDEHQQQLTDRLGGYGLVVPVEGRITAEHLARVDAPWNAVPELAALPRLQDCLPDLIEGHTS